MKHSLESEMLKDNEEFESKMIQQVGCHVSVFGNIFKNVINAPALTKEIWWQLSMGIASHDHI